MNITKKETTHEMLVSEPVHSLFIRALIPNSLAMLSASLTFFADAYTIGNGIGESGLAVLSLTTPISGLLYAFGAFLGFGGSTLFSVYYSAGEVKRARGVFTSTFLALLLVLAIIMIPGLLFTEAIVRFLGASGDLLYLTKLYARNILIFAPFYAIEQYITPFLRNDNGERVAMYGAMVGSLVNVLGDFIFIFGLHMNVAGVALAIGLSLLAIVTVDLSGLLAKGSNLRFTYHPDMWWDLYKSLTIGLPSMISEARASLVAFAFNWTLLMNASETEVAVYGILTNLTSIVVLLLMGPSNSMQPIVASNFGARKHERSREALKYSIIYSLAISVCFALIGNLFPRQVAILFIDDGNYSFIDAAIPAIRMAFISYIFRGLSVQLLIYMQSMSANKVATRLSILQGFVIPIVCVVALGFLFGATGVWVSLIAGEVISLLIELYALDNLDPIELSRAFIEDVEL